MYLDPGEILMFRKYLGGPVVATYTPVWDRKDVKNVVRDNKKAAKSELKARKRKLATVPAAPEASPWADAPAPDVWGPQPEEPWAPPAPAAEASPWTSDPAASGWSSGGGFPGPREHLRVVPGVVVEPTASQPLPEKPSFDPTAHLVPEQPAAVEEPVEKKAEPEQLRDTGTAGPSKPTGPARPTRRRRNADDMGDF
jgi:hypothetical protein